MPKARKRSLSQMIDLPFLIAALLTAAFYWLVTQEAMKGTLLHRYTTEHLVEYVIVAFFIWGLCDVACRALTFPREMLALRHDWLPARTAREPVARAAVLLVHLQKKPAWLRESRIGQRLLQAVAHLQEKGSADQFADYLHSLADQDDERTHANYGLIRFICWVTPVLGFLGTVLHFGTALGGLSVEEIGEKLPTVVGEMGTAFNTTTVALTAATTMMFCLFLCERTERDMVHTIDRRTERELLNRFEAADVSLAPFLNALQAASQANLQAMDATIQRQMEIWAGAAGDLQRQADERERWQAQLWQDALEKVGERFEANDEKRERRLLDVLNAMQAERREHQQQLQLTAEQVAGLQANFAEMVQALTSVVRTKQEIVELQSVLADNLRVLRETQQIDQALHGLTAAIHLLTARQQPPAGGASRAA
ncbi:MAG: MotA/TolQ/ExbB proton channel family protein [Planctomycetia bacterium]|nr:MotA/TolQ/ExbB proton channel family protein [Planctomycetia bacterium]